MADSEVSLAGVDPEAGISAGGSAAPASAFGVLAVAFSFFFFFFFWLVVAVVKGSSVLLFLPPPPLPFFPLC